MSLLADLVMRGCSYEFAMVAAKHEHLYDGDMEAFVRRVERIESQDEPGFDRGGGQGGYDQGRGIRIAEGDYEGDVLTYFGHDHWDDC